MTGDDVDEPTVARIRPFAGAVLVATRAVWNQLQRAPDATSGYVTAASELEGALRAVDRDDPALPGDTALAAEGVATVYNTLEGIEQQPADQRETIAREALVRLAPLAAMVAEDRDREDTDTDRDDDGDGPVIGTVRGP